MDILAYVEAEALKPFVWGETDCATTADRRFEMLHGFSLMQRFGRQVTDEHQAQAWLAEPGGIVTGIRQIMANSRVKRTMTPKADDIGIIIVGRRACVALFTGTQWWSRDADGIIVADDTYRYAAWKAGI